MVQLRDYQLSFVDEIMPSLAHNKRIIACSATGSGKSKTMLHIAERALSRGLTVLIITESVKIYSQFAQESYCININSDNKHAHVAMGRLHLAMAQTLIRRAWMMDIFHSLGNKLLVMADECHIGVMTGILSKLLNCWLIGWSATPAARWAKHLPNLYHDIVVGPQPAELVANGWLSKYKHWKRKAINEDDLEMKHGEFTEQSQEIAFGAIAAFEKLHEDLQVIPHKQCIIYTASCSACDTLYDEMVSAGYDVVKVHSNMSTAEANMHEKKFTKWGVKYCVSVGILTKGFDHPPIDLVVLWRSTTSLPLYLQMCGRGARICEGKEFFTVLDYGGNRDRFGTWNAERDWHSLWNKTGKPGIPPMKECPPCGYIMNASEMVCPNCGYVFQKNKIEKIETQLVEVDTTLPAKLSGRNIYEVSPKELALYAGEKGNKMYATKVATHLENYFPGYLKTFAIEMGYTPQWIYNRMAEKAYLNFTDTTLK